MPFLQGKALFDLTDTRRDDPATAVSAPPAPQLGQIRTYAGVGLQLTSNVRLDVGLLVRVRQVAGASPGTFDSTLDEGLWMQLFVDIPPA